jgi:hypothetical protein
VQKREKRTVKQKVISTGQFEEKKWEEGAKATIERAPRAAEDMRQRQQAIEERRAAVDKWQWEVSRRYKEGKGGGKGRGKGGGEMRREEKRGGKKGGEMRRGEKACSSRAADGRRRRHEAGHRKRERREGKRIEETLERRNASGK